MPLVIIVVYVYAMRPQLSAVIMSESSTVVQPDNRDRQTDYVLGPQSKERKQGYKKKNTTSP